MRTLFWRSLMVWKLSCDISLDLNAFPASCHRLINRFDYFHVADAFLASGCGLTVFKYTLCHTVHLICLVVHCRKSQLALMCPALYWSVAESRSQLKPAFLGTNEQSFQRRRITGGADSDFTTGKFHLPGNRLVDLCE